MKSYMNTDQTLLQYFLVSDDRTGNKNQYIRASLSQYISPAPALLALINPLVQKKVVSNLHKPS